MAHVEGCRAAGLQGSNPLDPHPPDTIRYMRNCLNYSPKWAAMQLHLCVCNWFHMRLVCRTCLPPKPPTAAQHRRPLNPRLPTPLTRLIRAVCIWGKSARVANYICMRFVHALQSLAYKLRRKCKATTIVASVRCSTAASPHLSIH